VRDEPITGGIGKVADKRYVAKNVAFAEENAVRLERIETVRTEDHDPPAGGKYTTGFAQGLYVVIDVLEDLVEEDDIEGVVGEWHTLTDREPEVWHLEGAFGDMLGVDVGAIDLVRKLAEPSYERTDPATDVIDSLALERDLLADHGEATLEAAGPDLAGVAKCGALVFGFDWFAGRHSGH
jgi:hypothetical protein